MINPLLTKLETLGPLDDADRSLLTDLTHDVRSFRNGQPIIREGERPDFVHLMVEGWSIRYQGLRSGKRQITAFLLPGDICDAHITILGEMDHSIGSLGPSKVALIDRKRMHALTERPAVARSLWWASLVDEGILRAWIVNVGQRGAFGRIAHLVCELHVRLAHVGLTEGAGFELPATQEDFSDALGLTPIHVNRVLKRLRDEGLMTFARNRVVVPDMVKLQQVADFSARYLHLSNNADPSRTVPWRGSPGEA